MKFLKYSIFSAILASLVLSSCSKDDEDYVFSDRCHISQFSLGSMRLEHHVKGSQGQDSTYYSIFQAALFQMDIDQRHNTITNHNPLPYNARLDRVLTSCTFESVLYHRAQGAGDSEWQPYSKKDSLDFTKPREFMVYSADGSASRIYTVTLTVSAMNPLETVWDSLGVCEQIKNLPGQERRLMTLNDTVVLLSQQPAEPTDPQAEASTWQCFCRPTIGNPGVPAQNEGQTERTDNAKQAESRSGQEGGWQERSVSGAEGAVLETLQQQGRTLYVSTKEGRILCSTDGQHWQPRMSGQPGLRLVGASENCLYAIVDGKLLGTNIETENWQEQALDDEAALLPEKDIATLTLTQPNGSKRLLMTGKTADGRHARLWAKLFGGKDADECVIGWSYYTENTAIRHTFPLLKQSNLLRYDKGMLLFGGAPEKGEGEALDTLYYSPDCGITWKRHGEMVIDKRMKAAAREAAFITATEENERYIWVLIDSQLWRGRLNRVAF